VTAVLPGCPSTQVASFKVLVYQPSWQADIPVYELSIRVDGALEVLHEFIDDSQAPVDSDARGGS
jgi:hypothetical protein